MEDWAPEEIKGLRKKLNLTQSAFAEKIAVTAIYVNYLEKGVRRPSRILCKLLDYVRKEAEGRTRKGE